MPDTAVIIDCEFLTAEGAPWRVWGGPDDPDPLLVQIGAVRLHLDPVPRLGERLELVVRPVARDGHPAAVDPFFTRLTGISEEKIRRGLPLAGALARLADFAGPSRLWSWGKDELLALGVSCYIEGIAPPIPAVRFGNACRLLLAAGTSRDEMKALRSGALARHFGLPEPEGQQHDALFDAMSVGMTLCHLLETGALSPDAFSDA